MIELCATSSEAWRAGRTDRLEAWYRRFSTSPTWPSAVVAGRLRREDEQLEDGWIFAVESDGTPVGQAALSLDGSRAILHDLWIAPEHQRHGHGRAALARIEAWAGERASVLGASVDPADPAHAALFRRYEPRAQNMIKQVSVVEDPGVTSRPMRVDEYPEFREVESAAYAQDLSESFQQDPAQALERSRREFDEFLPDGIATENMSILCLDAAGDTVATIWLMHHYLPDTTWVGSVTVDETRRGQGYGRAAMLTGERAAAQAGDGHIGLNVFASNPVAQHLYERLGYRTFNQQRSVGLG